MESIIVIRYLECSFAKNIRNEARVNEDLDQKSLLRKYERELKKLRAELEERQYLSSNNYYFSIFHNVMRTTIYYV